MASSDEQHGEGIDWVKWREEERERRAGKVGADEVGVDGKVSKGTQTDESSFQKERPMAIVRPNSHLKDAVAWRQQQ